MAKGPKHKDEIHPPETHPPKVEAGPGEPFFHSKFVDESDPKNVSELVTLIESEGGGQEIGAILASLAQGPGGIDLLAAFDQGLVVEFVPVSKRYASLRRHKDLPAGLQGICRIKSDIPGETQPTWGTGFLVAPNLVLTAGHVLYSHKTPGVAATNVSVISSDGTELTVDSFDASAGWKSHLTCTEDYGIVRLKGAALTALAVGIRNTHNLRVSLTGFPAGSATATTSDGLMGNECPCGTYHNIATVLGHSGAPIYIQEANPGGGSRYVAVAIQTRKRGPLNECITMNANICQDLSTWAGVPGLCT